MTTTCNPEALTSLANACFVQGTQIGNRRTIAKTLTKCINFKGGYRAAYREVKRGYHACYSYFGNLDNEQYGINCRY